jgi:hypothetical protein
MAAFHYGDFHMMTIPDQIGAATNRRAERLFGYIVHHSDWVCSGLGRL